MVNTWSTCPVAPEENSWRMWRAGVRQAGDAPAVAVVGAPLACAPLAGTPPGAQKPASTAASTVAKLLRLMTSLYPLRRRGDHARDPIGEPARREAHRLGELLHRQRLLPGGVGGAAQQRL